jgi:hypothetical protein
VCGNGTKDVVDETNNTETKIQRDNYAYKMLIEIKIMLWS